MGKRLFVGNMSFSMTEDDLEGIFSPYGEVSSVTVIRDRQTNRHQGFGFVEFSTDEEAAAAMRAVNGQEIQGRALRVDEARERSQGPRTGGGGYGGGGGGYGGGGGGGGYGGGGGGYGGGGGGGGRRW